MPRGHRWAMPWVYAKCKVTAEIEYQYEFLRSVECCELPGLGLDLIGSDIPGIVLFGTILEKKLFSSEQSIIKTPVEVR